MATRTSILAILTLCAGFAACSTEAEGPAPGNDGAGGKADDLADCAPDAELRIELVGIDKETNVEGDQLQNSVTATCFNATGFEHAACCEEAGLFEAYAAATSCPQRAVVIKPAGRPELQRCQDSATGQFVATACCAQDLCAPGASWDAGGRCRGTDGTFEDTLCCFNEAALASQSCEGAAWETVTIRGQERDVCRGESGAFALNTCCAAECVAAVSEESLGFAAIPEACAAKVDLIAADLECPAQAHPNAAQLCHNPANGQFVQAACCDAIGDVTTDRGEELDRDRSDLCFAGGTRAGCLRDEFVCSFDNPTRLAETTGDLDDSSARPVTSATDSLTDLDRSQLFAAAQHLGSLAADASFDGVFEVADDGEFELIALTVGELAVDWVKFFAGDNEVGVLFAAGTLDIVGEVSDGDLLGCGRPTETSCVPDIEKFVTDCMDEWIADTGGSFEEAIDFCDSTIRFGSELEDRFCGDPEDTAGECVDERQAQVQTCLMALAAG